MKSGIKVILLLSLFFYSCAQENITNELGMDFKYIKSGTFMMGNETDRPDESREEFVKIVEEWKI